MKFRHLHSIKEVPYGLFTLHVQLDFTIGEKSNLRIKTVLIEFLCKHIRNFSKRIFYSYFLRDMSLASFEFVFGFIFFIFGMSYGISNWINSMKKGVTTPVGTIMLSFLTVVVGIQFLLNFLAYDISSQPQEAIHTLLGKPKLVDMVSRKDDFFADKT